MHLTRLQKYKHNTRTFYLSVSKGAHWCAFIGTDTSISAITHTFRITANNVVTHNIAMLAPLVPVSSNMPPRWLCVNGALWWRRGVHGGQDSDHLSTLRGGNVLGHVNNGVHGHFRVSLNQAKKWKQTNCLLKTQNIHLWINKGVKMQWVFNIRSMCCNAVF